MRASAHASLSRGVAATLRDVATPLEIRRTFATPDRSCDITRQGCHPKRRHTCFVAVVGWTASRTRQRDMAALTLALPDEHGRLHFAGDVGTGFTAATRRELLALLAEREQPSPAISVPTGRSRWASPTPMHLRRWVPPGLVGEIAYREQTLNRTSPQRVTLGRRRLEVGRRRPPGRQAVRDGPWPRGPVRILAPLARAGLYYVGCQRRSSRSNTVVVMRSGASEGATRPAATSATAPCRTWCSTAICHVTGVSSRKDPSSRPRSIRA